MVASSSPGRGVCTYSTIVSTVISGAVSAVESGASAGIDTGSTKSGPVTIMLLLKSLSFMYCV
jgi:hypothetical protein